MPIFLYFEGNLRVYLHIYSIQKHGLLLRQALHEYFKLYVCLSFRLRHLLPPTTSLIYKEKGKVFSLFLFPGEGRNHPCSKYFLVSPGNVMAASSLRQLNGVNCHTHAIYNHSFLVTAFRQKQLVGAKNISSIITSLD